jgi:thioredoxin 2
MGHTMTICKSCGAINRVNHDNLKAKQAECGKCHQNLTLQGAVTEVDEGQFWKLIKKADKPVIVDFWASWCGPCKMYGPIFKSASLKKENAIFLKVNTESEQALAQKLGIRGIPSTIVFDKGKEVKRQAGVISEDALLNLT